jgi:hypothetical protein
MPSNMPYNSLTWLDKFKLTSLIFVFFTGRGFTSFIKERLLKTSKAKETLELGIFTTNCITRNIENASSLLGGFENFQNMLK